HTRSKRDWSSDVCSSDLFGKMIATKYGNITPKGVKFWVSAAGLGIVTGMLSGMFGIGSSTFIQIGLLVFFGFSVRQSVGTTLFRSEERRVGIEWMSGWA